MLNGPINEPVLQKETNGAVQKHRRTPAASLLVNSLLRFSERETFARVEEEAIVALERSAVAVHHPASWIRETATFTHPFSPSPSTCSSANFASRPCVFAAWRQCCSPIEAWSSTLRTYRRQGTYEKDRSVFVCILLRYSYAVSVLQFVYVCVPPLCEWHCVCGWVVAKLWKFKTRLKCCLYLRCVCRSVELVGKHYTTSNCQCQIKDVACRHWWVSPSIDLPC